MSSTDLETRAALRRIGSVIRGKWRIDALIGVGGMGAVYAATHRNGQRGALKLLHGVFGSDPAARERFLREGYVANQVDHPGVVSVLDDDESEDGVVFLVMELLDGTALSEVLERGPLNPDKAVQVGVELLDVLAAAHARGIVHRDIKPENLFLTRSGQLKVLDFGIARLKDAMNTGGGAGKTRTGEAMGTPAFMPPEQALGEWDRVDARSDIWAAGATLFNLLSGQLVHDESTVQKLMLAAMTKPARSLATARPELPRGLVEVVDKSLRFDRAHRYQSAQAMQVALRALPLGGDDGVTSRTAPGLASTSHRTNSPVSSDKPTARPRRSLAGPGAAVVAAALLLAGVGTLVWSKRGVGSAASSRGPDVVAPVETAPAPQPVPDVAAQAPPSAAPTVEPAASASVEPAPAPIATAAPVVTAEPRAIEAPRTPASVKPRGVKPPAGSRPTSSDPLNRW